MGKLKIQHHQTHIPISNNHVELSDRWHVRRGMCFFQTVATLWSQQSSGCMLVTRNQWAYTIVFLPSSLFHSLTLCGWFLCTLVCIPRPNKGVLACSFLLPHHLWNAFSHSSPSHEEWLKLLAWNSLCRVTNKYLRTEWQQASTPVKRFHISLWQPQAAQETAPLNTTHQTNTRHRH